MAPPDVFLDIFYLHRLMQCPICQIPAIPPKERQDLRKKLIDEETTELQDALEAGDLVAIADAICDAIVVILGTAHEYGIPFDHCWREVQRTNMAKVGPNGKAIFRADGKFLKPPGWQPPDLKSILEEAAAVARQRLRYSSDDSCALKESTVINKRGEK